MCFSASTRLGGPQVCCLLGRPPRFLRGPPAPLALPCPCLPPYGKPAGGPMLPCGARFSELRQRIVPLEVSTQPLYVCLVVLHTFGLGATPSSFVPLGSPGPLCRAFGPPLLLFPWGVIQVGHRDHGLGVEPRHFKIRRKVYRPNSG